MLQFPKVYESLFVRMLHKVGHFILKSIPNLVALEQEFIALCAEGEYTLPIFFFTITLHLLAIHGTSGLRRGGAFWATNMLSIERMHVVLKRLIRGASRNAMQTLADNLALYKSTAYARFDDDFVLGAKYPNSLAAMRTVPEAAGVVTTSGASIGVLELETPFFEKLIKLWAKSYPQLQRLIDIYEDAHDEPEWYR